MTTLAQLRLPEDETAAAVATHPSGAALVRAAWFSRAPKRLAASLAGAETAADDPGATGLPDGIGRPVIRQVAGRSEAELRALHGVGPKAVRVLTQALRERGFAPRG
ncbi:hypothetical protein [Streptomyces sp. 8K308]|uniref:hypothetical protein n=1 Tax=Streptomyces sp. 8K308 TaxID=2530388 RepID=UPI001A9EAC9B|nr:hypothetical protein [Streptomyces sp. 8K308]